MKSILCWSEPLTAYRLTMMAKTIVYVHVADSISVKNGFQFIDHPSRQLDSPVLFLFSPAPLLRVCFIENSSFAFIGRSW